jgi:hypothetical protein
MGGVWHGSAHNWGLTMPNTRSIISVSLHRAHDWGGLKLGKDYYKNEIIKLIEKIENAGTLEYLHSFIKLFLEKWG